MTHPWKHRHAAPGKFGVPKSCPWTVSEIYLQERHRAFPRDEDWDIPELPIRAPFVRSPLLLDERDKYHRRNRRVWEAYV